MRWFVDISSLAPGGDTSRFCVEAEQWQRALQSIRSLRGDTSPFSSFSIELLDEGYRAIDPTTRVRFVVQKAPDDAEIVLPNGGNNGTTSSKPPAGPASTKMEPPRSQSRRGRTGVSIPSDPVPRITSEKPPAAAPLSTPPASASPTSASTTSAAPTSAQPLSSPPRPAQQPASTPPASANGAAPADVKPTASRPMQAETAFEKMTQGLSFPVSSQGNVVVSDANTQILPPFKIQSEREQKPTTEAPLTYREMVLVVDEKTSLADAEAIARGQFEVLRASLARGPKGIFITVAVFDHVFDKKPTRLPLATLSFKDWRDKEPQTFFPLRDGPAVRASMAPPTAKVPSDARATALPPTTPSAAPPSAAPPSAALPSTAPPDVAPTTGVRGTALIPAASAVAKAAEAPMSVAPAPSNAPPATPTQASSGSQPAPAPFVPQPVPSAPESLTTVMEPPAEGDLEFGPDTVGTPRLHEESFPEPTPGSDAETQPIHVGPNAAQTTVSQPPAVSQAPTVSQPPTVSAAPVTTPSETSAAPEPQPFVSPTVTVQMPASQPPPPPGPAEIALQQQQAAPKKRVRGDDLIAELFEALSDLEFLSDPLEGADFVLATALEKIPCEAGMVSFFSLDKQEFVVVRIAGSVPKAALLSRASEKAGLLARAMRMNQTLIVSGTPARDVADDPRWKATALEVSCIACVPVNFGGRYLGILEIANPTDGIPLAAADGHALTYIGQQFAEFLSKRELVFDAERVLAPRLRDRVAK